MAHIDASLMKQIFDIPKRERETDVQHHCNADDLRTGFEVLEWRLFNHARRLREHPAPLKQSSTDKTPETIIPMDYRPTMH